MCGLLLLACRDRQVAEAVDRSRGAELVELVERPDLDLSVRIRAERRGEALRPFDALRAGLHLNHGVARDELLAFRERPVDERAAAAVPAEPETLCARLQSVRIEQHAGLCELLVIGRHRGD